MSSFILRDSLSVAVGIWSNYAAIYNLFRRNWGTEQVDGVVVYKEKSEYYNQPYLRHERTFEGDLTHDAKEWRRFLVRIGIKPKELEKQDYDEMDYCWLTLTQPPYWSTEYQVEDAVEDYTSAMSDMETEEEGSSEEEFTISIKVGGLGRDSFLGGNPLLQVAREITFLPPAGDDYESGEAGIGVSSAIDLSIIQAYVNANLEDYLFINGTKATALKNEYTVSVWDEDSSLNARDPFVADAIPAVTMTCSRPYGFYAMFDNEDVFETVRQTYPRIKMTQELYEEYDMYGSNITYEIWWDVVFKQTRLPIADNEFPSAPESTDVCIKTIVDEFERIRIYKQEAEELGGEYNRLGIFEPRETKIAFQSVPMTALYDNYLVRHPVSDDERWYDGKLRVDAATEMGKKEFCTLLGKNIDTEQQVEDSTILEKLFVPFIIVVAFVLAPWTGGGSLTLLQVAAIAGSIALTLSIGMALLAYFGGPSAMNLVKTIGAFAQSIGFVASILGVYSTVSNVFTQFVKTMSMQMANSAAGSLAGKVSDAITAIVDYITKQVSSAVSEAIDSALMETAKGFSSGIKEVGSWLERTLQIYDNYDKNFGETARNNEKAEELQQELDNMSKQNEMNSPSMIEIMGTGYFGFSMGSYDAISELDKKIEQTFGGWKEMSDPHSKLV